MMLSDPNLEYSLVHNPWWNAYWFSRMLINGDKYGAVGTESEFLTEICAAITEITANVQLDPDTQVTISKQTISELFAEHFHRNTARSGRIELLKTDLLEKIGTIDDLAVFVLSAQSIMIPINIALKSIPNNDKVFAETIAKAYLDHLGENALPTVIKFWDDLGVTGCLNAERIAVVRGFAHLRLDLQTLPDVERDMVLTAYVQEFERRLGQKRKARAGGSLEDVTAFLFDYFKIRSSNGPEHFQADIEVDKWIRCSNGWLIGISCKRTLRERWKQVSSASETVLDRFKIKQIWHITTYDEDLSDDKIVSLGSQKHIFYLPDSSRRLQNAQADNSMCKYVRPMSTLIQDIRAEQT